MFEVISSQSGDISNYPTSGNQIPGFLWWPPCHHRSTQQPCPWTTGPCRPSAAQVSVTGSCLLSSP